MLFSALYDNNYWLLFYNQSSNLLELDYQIKELESYVDSLDEIDSTDQTENLSYLEKLEKKKLERLKSIRNNINKYIQDFPSNNTDTTEANITNTSKKLSNTTKISSYSPITPITFDKLFLNINHIMKVYMSADYDRVVFYFADGRRFVFKVKNMQDKELMIKIMKFIPQSVRIVVICDKSLFTDKFGFLYTGESY